MKKGLIFLVFLLTSSFVFSQNIRTSQIRDFREAVGKVLRDSVHAATGSGISMVGNSPFGLIKVNDSTYKADSANLATLNALKDTAANIRANFPTYADTSTYQPVIDSTGQGWRQLLFPDADGHITSSPYLLYQDTAYKLSIGTNNPAKGGNAKLYVNGKAVVSGTLKVGAYTLPSTDGTVGQVLKTNGNGTLSFQNESGGGVTAGDTATLNVHTNPYNDLRYYPRSSNPAGYLTSYTETDPLSVHINDSAAMLSHYALKSYVDNGLSTKQDALISGTNIKTVNGNSLLGSGNLSITGGGSGVDTSSMINVNMFSGMGYSDTKKFQLAADYARVRNKWVCGGWNNDRNSRLFLFDSAVLIQSHCNFYLNGCTIKKSDSCRDNLFRTANIGYGLTNPLATAYTDISFTGNNWVIQGADNPRSSGDAYQTITTVQSFIINNGYTYGTDAGKAGRSQHGDWRNNMIQLCNVSNFEFNNGTIINSEAYGITCGYCSNGSVHHMYLQNFGYANGDTTRELHNQGALDFHQSYNDISVYDIHGFSQDDVLAYNTLNKDSTAGHYGYYPEGDTISSVTNRNISFHDIYAGSNNNVVRFILPPGAYYTLVTRAYNIKNTLQTTDPFYHRLNGTYASTIKIGETQGSGIGGNLPFGQFDDMIMDNISTNNSSYLIQVSNRVQNSSFTNLRKPNATAILPLVKSGAYADFKNVYSTRIDSNRMTISLSGVDVVQFDSTNKLWTSIGGTPSQLATWKTSTGFGVNALLNNTASGNVAFGLNALTTNTTGQYNVAFGDGSLQFNRTGQYNVANGYFALRNNTIGTGNVAIGYNALYADTSGNNNIAHGYNALGNNITGNDNVAMGYQSLYNNVIGGGNVAIGNQALLSNTTSYNVAIGPQALRLTTSGAYNVAIGYVAGTSNTTGAQNTAVGANALQNNTTGQQGTAVGASALVSNTTGNYNVAMGLSALGNVTTGYYNTGIGTNSGTGNATNDNNTGVGYNSNVGSGAKNTSLGSNAGKNNGTGSNNTSVGADAGPAVSTNLSNTSSLGQGAQPTASNQIALGNSSVTDLVTTAKINLANAQTTVSGSTSGNAVFSQPFAGSSYKKVIIYCNNLTGTASYTFPVAFTAMFKVTTGNSALITSSSNSAITVTGSGTTDLIVLEGY